MGPKHKFHTIANGAGDLNARMRRTENRTSPSRGASAAASAASISTQPLPPVSPLLGVSNTEDAECCTPVLHACLWAAGWDGRSRDAPADARISALVSIMAPPEAFGTSGALSIGLLELHKHVKPHTGVISFHVAEPDLRVLERRETCRPFSEDEGCCCGGYSDEVAALCIESTVGVRDLSLAFGDLTQLLELLRMGWELCLTGHGCSGSVAALTLLRLVCERRFERQWLNQVRFVGLGAPRLVWAAGAAAVGSRTAARRECLAAVESRFVYVDREDDAVPRILTVVGQHGARREAEQSTVAMGAVAELARRLREDDQAAASDAASTPTRAAKRQRSRSSLGPLIAAAAAPLQWEAVGGAAPLRTFGTHRALTSSSCALRAVDPKDAGLGPPLDAAALSAANFVAHAPESYRFPAAAQHSGGAATAAAAGGDKDLMRTRVLPLKQLLASHPAQVMCPHDLLSSALGQYIFRPCAEIEDGVTALFQAYARFEALQHPNMSLRSVACTLASLVGESVYTGVHASHVLCMAVAPQTFLSSDVPTYTVDGHVFSTLCSLPAARSHKAPLAEWQDVQTWFERAKTYRAVVGALSWMGRQRTAPLLGHILGAYLDPAAFLLGETDATTGSFTRHWTGEPNSNGGSSSIACTCLSFAHYCEHAGALRPSADELRGAEFSCASWTDMWRGAFAVTWLAAAVDATLVKESHLRCLVAHPTYFVSAKSALTECADHAAASCSPLWTAIQHSDDLKVRTIEHFAKDEPVLLRLHSTMRPMVYWVLLLTVAMRFRKDPCAQPDRHHRGKPNSSGGWGSSSAGDARSSPAAATVSASSSYLSWIVSWFTGAPQPAPPRSPTTPMPAGASLRTPAAATTAGPRATTAAAKDSVPRDFVRACYVDFVKDVAFGEREPSASDCPPSTGRLRELEREATASAARRGNEPWIASAVAAVSALRAALDDVLTVAICGPEDVGKTRLARLLTGQTDAGQSPSDGIDLYHRTMDLDWRPMGRVRVGPAAERPCFVLDTPGVFVNDRALKQTLVTSYVQCCCVVVVVIACDRASLWSDVMDACMTRIYDAHRMHDMTARFVVLLNKFDDLVQRSGWDLDKAHRVANSLCGYVERTYPWVDQCSVSMLLTPQRSLVGLGAPHLVHALEGDLEDGRVLDGQHIRNAVIALLQRNSLRDRVGHAPSQVDLLELAGSQC